MLGPSGNRTPRKRSLRVGTPAAAPSSTCRGRAVPGQQEMKPESGNCGNTVHTVKMAHPKHENHFSLLRRVLPPQCFWGPRTDIVTCMHHYREYDTTPGPVLRVGVPVCAWFIRKVKMSHPWLVCLTPARIPVTPDLTRLRICCVNTNHPRLDWHPCLDTSHPWLDYNSPATVWLLVTPT